MARKWKTHAAIRTYYGAGDRVWWQWACKCGASDLRTKDLRKVDCCRCLNAINKALKEEHNQQDHEETR